VRGASLSPAAEEYLSWLVVERGRATNTIASYRRDLVHYEAVLAGWGRTPREAAPGDLERYVAGLRAQGRSPASVARAISAVRGLHRFLLDEGEAQADPTEALEPGPLPARLPKALLEADVARVLDGVSGDDPISRRDRALLELLYATGARVSEAVGLNLVDLVDRTDAVSGVDGLGGVGGVGVTGLVRLYGKGSKERLVPLGSKAAEALNRWLAPGGRDVVAPARWRHKDDAEAVFLNTRGSRLSRQGAFGVVRQRGAAVGVELGPHALRHSCATHLLEHGADVRVVQELLGHASVTTTQLYTKVTSDHLRAAYDAAHPRARSPIRPADV
jgi:integrase/recombinase XerD